MQVLSVKNVTHTYEGAKNAVLSNVRIDFDKGKIYSIVGKSGAGKTTLLSLIAGLECYQEGEILYNNKPLSTINKDDYRAKEIGVIFQGYNLLTNSTALENILLAMDISQVKKQNKKQFALSLLQQVGIDDEKANRKVLELSGGEQQRVAIARALSHDPDIIIADEPTGNLDHETEEEVLNILGRLSHEEGKCVIIVTHSDKVSHFGDEVWGLAHGNLLFIK